MGSKNDSVALGQNISRQRRFEVRLRVNVCFSASTGHRTHGTQAVEDFGEATRDCKR